MIDVGAPFNSRDARHDPSFAVQFVLLAICSVEQRVTLGFCDNILWTLKQSV